jgi:uncharacterized protein YjbI with pentapeptide repeats
MMSELEFVEINVELHTMEWLVRRGANLREANLRGANLGEANLGRAKIKDGQLKDIVRAIGLVVEGE